MMSQCKQCGQFYHETFKGARDEHLCDDCELVAELERDGYTVERQADRTYGAFHRKGFLRGDFYMRSEAIEFARKVRDDEL